MKNPFRRNIEPRCAYCQHGSTISETQVICPHKGVMDAAGHCFRFRYDPLRRTPPRPVAPKTGAHSAEEFSI